MQLRFFDAHGVELARFSSASTYVAAAKAYLADSHSHHRVWNPRLTVLSDAVVTAEWEMEDFIVFLPGDGGRPRFHHGGGRYHETWKLREGEWVITDLELRRSFLETPRQESPFFAGDLRRAKPASLRTCLRMLESSTSKATFECRWPMHSTSEARERRVAVGYGKRRALFQVHGMQEKITTPVFPAEPL